MTWPTALTIAGSDSGGGAGIQADLKTFSALGVYGASAITALTAQNTRAVTGVMDVPAEFVTRQIDAVFDDIAVHAVKIGMVSQVATIRAIADCLRRYGPAHVVLDPVMIAKSGDALLDENAIAVLRDELLPLATLVTPNIPEAQRLLGREGAVTEGDMAALAAGLAAQGPRAVLVKGGHLEGPESTDFLRAEGMTTRLPAARVATRNTHGTGCTLSSAVAAFLARGHDLAGAVGAAKTYITSAIAEADRLGIGGGHGPVHHFHALWQSLTPTSDGAKS